MNNRKSYNSIFFLTVYLGLVLVGASPQVLANAATNSFFDLRNEIEYKDDLDKKPDDSCPELKAKTNEQDNQFIEDYVKIITSTLEKLPSELDSGFFDGINEKDFQYLKKDVLIGFNHLKDYENGFNIKINFDDVKKSTSFAISLHQSLKLKRVCIQKPLEKKIYEKTAVSFLNNQVYIITNLPRASIDLLLK